MYGIHSYRYVKAGAPGCAPEKRSESHLCDARRWLILFPPELGSARAQLLAGGR
jgi:hypothetical protein